MKHSQTLSEIAPALLAAQQQIANVVRGGVNPHFKSKYATLDSVLDVCKSALNANEISFLQGAKEGTGDTVTLTTRLLHKSGEWIESDVTMRPVKADPQGVGSCITYARRYSLSAMCGVASEEDDDANAASEKPEKARNGSRETTAKTDKKHDAALEAFRDAWGKMPDEKRNSISSVAIYLPLVGKWSDVKEQTTEDLLIAVDRINETLSEAK